MKYDLTRTDNDTKFFRVKKKKMESKDLQDYLVMVNG